MKSPVQANLTPHSTVLSHIDCSTYAHENHCRCNGANYYFSQTKCGVMNQKLILMTDRRAKVNNGGKDFYRSIFYSILRGNKTFRFLFE